MKIAPQIIDGNWRSVRQAISKLSSLRLGTEATPTFAGLSLTGLTASRLLATNASKALESSDLFGWIAVVANELDIVDDGDGTVTLGIVNPLIVAKGGTGLATITDHGIMLGSGTGAVTPLGAATDGELPIGSTGADPVLASLTGTANQITVTDGAGSITLSLPQDIHTGASPTFAGLTISGSVSSDLIPATHNFYDLGSVTHQWKILYGVDVTLGGSLSVPTLTVDTIIEKTGGHNIVLEDDLHILNGSVSFGSTAGNEYIASLSANNLDLNAATRIDLNIGGALKAAMTANSLTVYTGVMYVDRSGGNTFAATYFGRKTRTSGGGMLDGDDLLSIIPYCSAGSYSYVRGGEILFEADGDWSTGTPNSAPTKLSLWTCPSGSATRLNRFRIDNAGDVEIGGASNRLEVTAGGDVSFVGIAKLTLPNKTGSTTEGDIWKDTAQKSIQGYIAGIEQTLIGCIFSQTANQTIANTTTETTMFGTGVGTLTLPANFWTVGKTLRFEIHGDFGDTGNPTAEVQVYQGATSLIDSGAITLSGLAGTEEWECHVIITCRSVGGTGSLETVIDWEYETSLGSSPIERLDVAGTLTTIDTTSSQVLDATFQWGTANALNTLTSEVAVVEVIN